MMKIKYFSLFSGIGGFELGIQQAYENIQKLRATNTGQPTRSQTGNQDGRGEQLFEFSMEGLACVGFSEIDKYAIQIYQKHFPNHKNYGDITKIDEKELPDFDLLCGGFPCQAFSIAGKRAGFDDTRGTLFFDIARIAKQKQPRLLLLENVKGLLSHDDGRTFRTIIATLDELGYDVQWQVLNSKNHGVPQNRERVYIVGHLRGTPRPEVFPFTESSGSHLREITYGVSDAQRIYDAEGVGKTLKGLGGGLGAKTGLYIQNPKMQGGTKKNYQNSVAITATSYKEPPVVSGIRRLTPKECERLQGFPDDWTKHGSTCTAESEATRKLCANHTTVISDTQRYKCCGNAVTVNVVRDVVERLLTTPPLPR